MLDFYLQDLVETRKLPDIALERWAEIKTPRLQRIVQFDAYNCFFAVCGQSDFKLTVSLVAAKDAICSWGLDRVIVLDCNSKMDDFHDAAPKKQALVVMDNLRSSQADCVWTVERRFNMRYPTLLTFSDLKSNVLANNSEFSKIIGRSRCVSQPEKVTSEIGTFLAGIREQLPQASHVHYELLQAGMIEIYCNDHILLGTITLKQDSISLNLLRRETLLRVADPDCLERLTTLVDDLLKNFQSSRMYQYLRGTREREY